MASLGENRPGLGRLQEHDERSRAYMAPRAGAPQTVTWQRFAKCFDQGQLGCCTGAAMAGLLMTAPFHVEGRRLRMGAARGLYSRATHIDAFDGAWPPQDTGSSGLAVAKAAKELGWINGYSHAFGLDHALGALAVGPVITGVPWYDSMDTPDRYGVLRVTSRARVVGGHEFLVMGCDVEKQRVRIANSWGRGWGENGYAWLPWDVWGRLLGEGGDVTTVTV